MRRGRIWTVLALAVVGATVAWSGSLLADPGEGEDPAEGNRALDITEFTHDDDAAGIITYTLTTNEGWSNDDDLDEIVWTLDFTPADETADTDACIVIEPVDPPADELEVTFLNGCSDTDPQTVTATATHEEDDDPLVVEYPRAALDTANEGTEVEAYSYFIEATDQTNPTPVTDRAPDEGTVTHTLSAQADPTPTPDPDSDSDPTPDPDSDPTPESTEEPTATAESGDEPQLPATGSGAMRTAATAFVLLGSGSVLISHARRKTRGG